MFNKVQKNKKISNNKEIVSLESKSNIDKEVVFTFNRESIDKDISINKKEGSNSKREKKVLEDKDIRDSTNNKKENKPILSSQKVSRSIVYKRSSI